MLLVNKEETKSYKGQPARDIKRKRLYELFNKFLIEDAKTYTEQLENSLYELTNKTINKEYREKFILLENNIKTLGKELFVEIMETKEDPLSDLLNINKESSLIVKTPFVSKVEPIAVKNDNNEFSKEDTYNVDEVNQKSNNEVNAEEDIKDNNLLKKDLIEDNIVSETEDNIEEELKKNNNKIDNTETIQTNTINTTEEYQAILNLTAVPNTEELKAVSNHNQEQRIEFNPSKEEVSNLQIEEHKPQVIEYRYKLRKKSIKDLDRSELQDLYRKLRIELDTKKVKSHSINNELAFCSI